MTIVTNDEAVQNFATIWEHVECGICIIDAATREILAINPVAARMFGNDAEQMLGQRCHKFICPAEEYSCPIMDKGQVVDRSERKFVRADGTSIPIVKSVAKIHYKGRLALLESFTDISNLKEAEEKLVKLQVTEAANRAKSDFLSRMSHEMRTPMNAIIGMTKIAENTNDADKLKYCLSMIDVSATHLLGLINDVLDMAKIEAGKFDLDTAPFSIEDILVKICNLVSEQTEEKGITFTVLFDPAMPMQYAGDELRLSQVIANLISNAVKFTPRNGTVTLRVEEHIRNAGHSVVRFAISDTGIGMTPEQVAKLFNAFEQADTSISRRFGGTGLGLVISKNIVDKMDGAISVTSALGEGSTFTVDVKLAHTNAEKCIFDASIAGKRVLFADPNLNDAERFACMAKVARIQHDAVTTVDEVFTHVDAAHKNNTPYDVIFVDYALAPSVAANLPPAQYPLALTATFRQWSSLKNSGPEAGIRNFLSKPLFPSAIADVIRKATGGTASNMKADVLAPGATPDFSHVSLLLAEDVAINREIFASLLEDTNLRIDMAEDGAKALEKFRANPDKYDIIVMDVQMPGMDGYEATTAIRALDFEKAKAIPIIAMTANVFSTDIEKCLACGMNDHMAKPIDEKAVFEKLKQYCCSAPLNT